MLKLKNAILVSLWFMFLTFPIMVVRVNTIEKVVQWRWMNLLYVGVGAFALSFVWDWMLKRRETGGRPDAAGPGAAAGWMNRLTANRALLAPVVVACCLAAAVFPFVASMYQVNIVITALIYVVLGLGLNIVVGLSGLLVLGYVAFYAVGAYSYALLNHHFDLGFWTVLPIGAGLGALFGILLGFPVLRLRGDYLAIVTLGFGEIIRLVLENWSDFSMGPSGVSGIDRPALFGMKLSVNEASIYMYFIILGLAVLSVFLINRLKGSRIGRAWMALREDEIACQAMGIDKTWAKLSAFALGAAWAGLVGVVFAGKTVFVNPSSFTFMESAIILAIVVLGGMGSITGVILAALIIMLLPEFLREFSLYRMLIFGAAMVLMMIVRPQGLVSGERKVYRYKDTASGAAGAGNV